jgi:hypothetical protein
MISSRRAIAELRSRQLYRAKPLSTTGDTIRHPLRVIRSGLQCATMGV